MYLTRLGCENCYFQNYKSGNKSQRGKTMYVFKIQKFLDFFFPFEFMQIDIEPFDKKDKLMSHDGNLRTI